MQIQTGRVYRLSRAGAMALEARKSVPGWYRTILAMVHGDTPAGEICATLEAHSRKQVITWLEQMETLGFIEAVDPAPTEVILPHRQAA